MSEIKNVVIDDLNSKGMNNPLRCKKCGEEIKGGFYNTPNGAYCCECWDKVPQQKKDKALAESLRKLAMAGSCITNMLK